jgi:hypothetical protein
VAKDVLQDDDMSVPTSDAWVAFCERAVRAEEQFFNPPTSKNPVHLVVIHTTTLIEEAVMMMNLRP